MQSSLPRSALFSAALGSLLTLACGGSDEPTGGMGIRAVDPMATGGAGTSTGGGTVGGSTGGAFNGTGGALGTGGAPGGTGGATSAGPSHVVVVAHQDDDLLFINPELKRIIDRGERLTTAYLTSGHNNEPMSYVLEREAGIKSAYAFMAGIANAWTCAPQSYAGKSIETCQLNGKDVGLVFFRLPDGQGDGSHAQSLLKVWTSANFSSSAVDASGLSFNRAEIIASVADVFSQTAATEVYTTDFSFQNPEFDHSDHEISALITAAASGAYASPHGLRSFVTYSTSSASENLSGSDAAIVSDTFAHYASCDKFIDGCVGGAGCDSMMCQTSSDLYRSWFSRLYDSARKTPGTSAQLSSTSGCVNAGATFGACSGSTWTWGPDYSLQDSNGMCLTAPSTATPRTVTATACSGSGHQKWFVMDNGLIVSGASPAPGETFEHSQCLRAGAWAGDSVSVASCGNDSALNWTF